MQTHHLPITLWTLLVRLCCEDAAYVYNMALVYFFDSFGYLTVLLLFWVYKYGLLRTQNSLHNTREKSVQLWQRNDKSMICDSFRSEQSCSFMFTTLTTVSRKCVLRDSVVFTFIIITAMTTIWQKTLNSHFYFKKSN